ncbi:MAG: ABC transporter permease [Alphaproteobacteria bacterium]|nr:ABC transporter permease [Alphaproteobacteria bacterium]
MSRLDAEDLSFQGAGTSANASLGAFARIVLTIGGGVALLLVWEGCVDWLNVPPYILPTPVSVLRALWSGLDVPLDSPMGFYLPIASTLSNSVSGFAIGALLGIAVGSLMAESRVVEIVLMPYAFALQVLPKVAIAPLIVIWFGFGNGSKIAMAALLAFFPLMVNAFTGLRTTEPERLELMQALSASRLETYRVVKLPSAAPYIFAGLDMGMVYALLGTIVAEFLGAQQGIGVTIVQAQAATDVASVFAALILLGVIGIVLHMVIRLCERRIIHWTVRHKT